VVASRPSQSPRDEKTIEFQSLRKAGIAKTPRVAAGAGAAGLGKPWVMGLSLSGVRKIDFSATNAGLSAST
jgi:hypothetical protein